jgi:hypothetical protein
MQNLRIGRRAGRLRFSRARLALLARRLLLGRQQLLRLGQALLLRSLARRELRHFCLQSLHGRL